jgi:methylglutaconyl-CoA hydratase
MHKGFVDQITKSTLLNAYLSSSTPSRVAELQAQLEPLDGENEGIFLLSLNRPERKNAIGKQMLKELRECLDHLSSERSTRCVVIRSQVPKVFCAGIDFNEKESMTTREWDKYVRDLRNVIKSLEGLLIPTIASVSGYAVGVGSELALACDLRVGGKESAFAFPDARLGMIPSCGGTQRLSRLVGRSRAKLLLYTGRGINSIEASEIGLLDIVDQGSEDPLDEALSLARSIGSSAPLAVQGIKLAINLGAETELSTGMKIEEAVFESVKASKDNVEGLQALAQKRSPDFKGE